MTNYAPVQTPKATMKRAERAVADLNLTRLAIELIAKNEPGFKEEAMALLTDIDALIEKVEEFAGDIEMAIEEGC